MVAKPTLLTAPKSTQSNFGSFGSKPASTGFGSFGSKPASTGFRAGGFTTPTKSGSGFKTAAGAGALGAVAGSSIGGGGFTAPKSFGSNTFGSMYISPCLIAWQYWGVAL